MLSLNSFSQTMPTSGTNVGASSGTWTVPANVYSIKIDAWGGGGAGAGQSTSGTGGLAGGAGGSRSTTTISVTPGQTIYYNIGAARTGTSGNAADGNDTWVSKLSNTAPTVSTDGVVAKGGKSAVGTTQGAGSTTGCVGTSSRGGSGRVGGASSGGGGSSAGTTLAGVDATGTAGATAPAGGGNGGAGHASGGNGTAGSTPGGGGGGAYKNNTTSRTGGSGAAGRVILTYSVVNDLCANAISTSCNTTFNGTTVNATQTGDAPSCYNGSLETWTAPGVWYKVIGNGRNVTLSLCTGTAFDTKLFVYTGTCGSLTCLTYSDDFCSTQSEVTFATTDLTEYYVMVTGYGSATGAFQLSVTYGSSPPTITTQPINETTCTAQVTFSVTASGVRQPFTYQWYLNNSPISGTNSLTYSTSTLGNYYVSVTNSCNESVNSNTVSLTTATSPSVTLNTYSSQICAGGSGTNNISSTTTSGTPTYSYQWQFFNSTWQNSVTTSTINATPTLTRDYRLVVTDLKGCQITSPIHTVNVIPDPINPTLNTKTPNTNNVCVGTNLSATFNSGSDGVGCSDIFQYTTNGTSWQSYTPGSTISTSSIADGITVQIRGRRGSCSSGIGCSNNAYDILASWTVRYPPTLSTTSVNVSCNGGNDGSIDLTPLGNSPFNFTWSNGGSTEDISNLTSGDYSVTVTDLYGCTSTTSVTITQPTLLTTTSTNFNPSCFGSNNGSINLTPSGGTSPYTFLWSNGQTTEDIFSLVANTYSVTVTDSKGCQTTRTVTITQPTQLTTTVTTTNVNCYGGNNGSASVSASGGTPPYLYMWNTGNTQSSISNLTSGNYQITVTDNKGCTKITNLNISQPSELSISLDITTYPNCGSSNGVVSSSVIGGTPPFTYSWSNGQTTQNLTGAASGNYTLTVTDSKGCQSISPMTLGCTSAIINVGQIIGSSSICGLTTGSYSIDYSNASPESITWILPNGVTSNNGLNSPTINVNFSSGFVQDSIEVDVVSNGVTYHRSIWVTKLPNKPIVSGSFCGEPTGSIKSYIVTNSQPNVTYNWIPPYGVNVYSGQGNDTVQFKASIMLVSGSSGSVTATNSCGSSTKTFTLDRYVVRPTSILGPTTVCADGNTIYTYRVDSVPTSFMYIWNVPNGVSVIGSSSNDTLKVKFSTNFTSGQFSVMSVNQCGSSPMTYGTVSNNNIYTNIGTITGPGDLCPYLGQSVTYSVTNQSGTFTWSVPTNMTIQTGQGTNSITVLVSNSFSSGTISVNLNNGCGGSISSSKTLSTTTSTISASSISGVRSVCSLVGTNTPTTFSVTPISGVNYVWSVPANSTIVSGQGTNSINVTFQNGFTGGNIQVIITGGCGNPITRTRLVDLGLPSVSISGVNCVDNGYTNTYSVSTTGALSFNWAVPGNAQIVRGQGTNSIDVFFPSNFESTSCINNSCDSIRLTTQFGCGNVLSKKNVGLLTVRPTVTGTSSVCFPDTIRLTASTSPRITSYIWSNSNGTQFIGSTTGNSVMAKTSSSFMGGTFSVMGVNSCGSSPMAYFGVNKVCPNTAKTIGFGELENKDFEFIVFPNPGNGLLQIRIFHNESQKFNLIVSDILGKVYLTKNINSEDEIDLRFLNTGFYQITIYDKNNNHLTTLFSKLD